MKERLTPLKCKMAKHDTPLKCLIACIGLFTSVNNRKTSIHSCK